MSCQETECNRYEQLIEKCLYIHKELYCTDQQYKESVDQLNINADRSEKRSCINWMKLSNERKTEFKDKKRCSYPNMRSFRRS